MPNLRRYLREHEQIQRIARAMRRRLIALLSSLAALLLVLLFNMGASWWPAWLLDHRRQIIGLVAFAILCIVAVAPLLIEADTNPRPLSGPGKNPKGPW